MAAVKTPAAPAKPAAKAAPAPTKAVATATKPAAPAKPAPAKPVPAPVKNPVKTPARATPVLVGTVPAVKTDSKTGKVKSPFDDRYLAMQNEIDSIEKSVGIETTSLIQSGYVQNAIHTGVLMYDFVTGGGAAPGRLSILPGLEGSGKSTIVDNLAAVCALQQIPIFWFDAEGALDANYVGRIFARYGLKLPDLMGVRDPKTGKWLLPPMLRYSQESIGDKVFKTIAHICSYLPMVKQRADGVWFRMNCVKGRPNSWVEDERQGKPQFLFIVDSWPALLPESRAENVDSSPMAANARMIAANMPLIKAPIAAKNCALFSVNQIRMRPGVTMGNPQYEPCGTALGFFSDVRTQIMKVAPSTIKAGTGQFTEEPNINGAGVDKYVYAKLKNTKNKAFTPYREGSIRIRFEQDGGPGDGICRVWDTTQFLLATGQAIPRVGQKLEMHLRPVRENGRAHNLFEEGQVVSRGQFKQIIEAPQYKDSVYQHCLQQIRSGYAFDIERAAVKRLIASSAKDVTKGSINLDVDGDNDAASDDEGGIEA